MSDNRYIPVFSLRVQSVVDDESWPSYAKFRYDSHYKDVKGASTLTLAIPRKPLSIDYCKEEDLPEKTDEIREAEECFCKLLIGHCSWMLMDGETLEKDFFTYLLAPEGIADKYTAILLRKTSMAELLYIIHSVKVLVNGDVPALQKLSQTAWAEHVGLSYSRLPTYQVSVACGPTASAGSVASGITKSLLNYMLKKITDEVGMAFLGPLAMAKDLIFDILYPGLNEFKEIYDIMKKVVKQELRENDIDHINGTLSNIGQDLHSEYSPIRQELDLSKKENRKDLMEKLQNYDAAYLCGSGMLGLLEQTNYQKVGLGAYICGQTLRLSIYQECATVDPSTKPDGTFLHPLESSYGKPYTGIVAQTAKYAAEYVQRVWPQVLMDRANAIHIVRWQEPLIACDQFVTFIHWAKVKDDVTGDEWAHQMMICDKNHGRVIPQGMKDLLSEKQQQAKSVLAYQMGNPDKLVSQWKQLIEKPLNM